MPNFSGLNVTVMTILALLAAVFAVFYLIYSAGLYGMAKKRGIRHAWLAFLPIGRNYITGKLVPMLKLGLLEVADMQIVYPLLAVLSLLCLAVRLNILAAIFFSLLFLLCLCLVYSLFAQYFPERAAICFLISLVFLGLPASLFVFHCRQALPKNPPVPESEKTIHLFSHFPRKTE